MKYMITKTKMYINDIKRLKPQNQREETFKQELQLVMEQYISVMMKFEKERALLRHLIDNVGEGIEHGQ